MTYEDFIKLPKEVLIGWRINYAYVNGTKVGIALTKKHEIHVIAFENNHKFMTRKNIQSQLKWMLRRYGKVTTRYPLAEGEPRLMTRLGFNKAHEDSDFTYWVLTKMPFEKSK